MQRHWNTYQVKSVCLVVAAGILLMHLSIAHGSTSVRGQNRTCRDYADLDSALDHPASAYFRGWTSQDFDAAQKWVSSCFASPPTKEDNERLSLLRARRAAMESRGEIWSNDEAIRKMRDEELKDQQEKDAQLRSEEAQRRAGEAKELAELKAQQTMQRAGEAKDLADRKAKQAAHDECLRSDTYQRYVAGRHILDSLDQESRAQQALDRESRVEAVSGTTNLYAKRNAGESLVNAQDNISKWWSVYRQYGGDAQSTNSISRSLSDPCN